MLRAYDKVSGQQVRRRVSFRPAERQSMTYMVDGKQYIVVAVSGGSYSGEYMRSACRTDVDVVPGLSPPDLIRGNHAFSRTYARTKTWMPRQARHDEVCHQRARR